MVVRGLHDKWSPGLAGVLWAIVAKSLVEVAPATLPLRLRTLVGPPDDFKGLRQRGAT